MATVAVNVTYGFDAKKFSVPKSTTVSQLAGQAAAHFKLSGSALLVYKGKALDGSLPLRLTPLSQNGTVELKKSSGTASARPVAIKVATPDGAYVVKTTTDQSVLAVIAEAEQTLKVQISKPNMELLVMNAVVSDLSTPLASMVGSAANAVIRVRYNDFGGARQREQQEAVQKQLDEQRQRNQQRRLERERAEEERQARIRSLRDTETADAKDEEATEPVEAAEPAVHPIEPVSAAHPEPRGVPYQPSKKAKAASPELPAEPVEPAAPVPANQLFTPSTQRQPVYENPEDDYVMTVDQAKAYQNSIRRLAARPAKHSVAKPTKYLIRLRFPDRSILQLNFVDDVANLKLGQVIKKLDEVLREPFVGNYNLKLAYPPFERVPVSWDANATRLHDLPKYFDTEKVVLIWEPTQTATSAPYIKEGVVVETTTTLDLPEVRLETHRGELPGDRGSPAREVSKELAAPASSLRPLAKPGMPKWMQIGRK